MLELIEDPGFPSFVVLLDGLCPGFLYRLYRLVLIHTGKRGGGRCTREKIDGC